MLRRRKEEKEEALEASAEVVVCGISGVLEFKVVQ